MKSHDALAVFRASVAGLSAILVGAAWLSVVGADAGAEAGCG